MAKPAPCPRCKESLRTLTLILGRTNYCLSCGWNCEEAQGQIRAELLSTLVVSVLALAIAVFVWFKNPGIHWMAAAILVAAMAVPLCNAIPDIAI